MVVLLSCGRRQVVWLSYDRQQVCVIMKVSWWSCGGCIFVIDLDCEAHPGHRLVLKRPDIL